MFEHSIVKVELIAPIGYEERERERGEGGKLTIIIELT